VTLVRVFKAVGEEKKGSFIGCGTSFYGGVVIGGNLGRIIIGLIELLTLIDVGKH
jgi:hypothetical protein